MRGRVVAAVAILALALSLSLYLSATRYGIREVIELEFVKGYSDGFVIFVPHELRVCVLEPRNAIVEVAVVSDGGRVELNATHGHCAEVRVFGVAIVVLRVVNTPNALVTGANPWIRLEVETR